MSLDISSHLFFLYLSISLHTYLSIYLSISVCLSVCLSFYQCISFALSLVFIAAAFHLNFLTCTLKELHSIFYVSFHLNFHHRFHINEYFLSFPINVIDSILYNNFINFTNAFSFLFILQILTFRTLFTLL